VTAGQPGTDGALAMAMGHMILREFPVERRTPFFVDYAARYTDLPFLVRLSERDGGYVPDRFLSAADLPAGGDDAGEGAEWKTVLVDGRTGDPAVPNGSLGFRHTDSGAGRWNLDLGDVAPRLTLWRDPAGEQPVEVLLPRFDTADGHGEVLRRGVPVRRIGGQLVTTVFDLVLAQYGVGRDGLPGDWPTGYDDPDQPYTPAWQERFTSVPASSCLRVARELADNAERSGGRTMIIMGAGVCQWFHGDATYRAILSLLLFTGSMGRNGGGWAHYVGQEKCRPLTGHSTVAMATDWSRPPRTAIGTAFWYTHTDQWRYDGYRADALASPLAEGQLAGMHTADTIVQSARSAGCRRTRSSTATRWSSPTRSRPPAPTRESTSWTRCGPAGCGGRPRIRTRRRTGHGCSPCGGPTCWARRRRATSTSSSTCSARTRPFARPRPRRTAGRGTSAGGRRRPRASSTCWSRSTSG
jgi:nitrate reductase / nitrite oxidoreductase, alpha subunit